MSRSYFHDCKRDDGLPITVEYSATGGEPNFDHPGHICDGGGSGPEIMIVAAMPNTPQYENLCKRRNALTFLLPRDAGIGMRLWKRIAVPVLSARMWWAERGAALTDAECERIEASIAETYVEGTDDDYDF